MHEFKVYLYNSNNKYENFEEYKKLEHHFDYLYGNNPGSYSNIKVIDHTKEDDPFIEITGKISGVSKDDFFDYILEGAESNYNLDDIDMIKWN